ncbi:MAG TPA: hypothetical protein VFJ52_00130 [Terriglobia bacterium]|nr:hypothetical protein [Terriglobia bacterium]
MVCPICEKRKAKRYCPARAETICTVCCGTEREVTIDCPSDCTYLMESRKHDLGRQEIDWSSVPFAETEIPSSFTARQERLILALGYAICLNARDHPAVTDTDVIASVQSLAEAYQTLSSGIYYEKPPDYAVQRGVYDALKAAIENYKQTESQNTGLAAVRDSEIRDALIFLTQLGATRANGRPKGRAYLDLLRSQFKSDDLQKSSPGLLVVP